MKTEQKEALLRIPIGIFLIIVIEILAFLLIIFMLCNFVYTLVKSKRHKTLAEFSNMIVTYIYNSWRYLSFNTNHRPFPFNDYQKPFDKFDSKVGQ